MKELKFESESSYHKFGSKTLSNGLFVRENDVTMDDRFLVNETGDLITLVRTQTKHFILKDDLKYFVVGQ